MANRFFTKESFQLVKNVTTLYAQVKFGATGAPTLVANNSKGIYSVTRNSAGVFTFVLGSSAQSLDTYNNLLLVDVAFDATANSGTAPAAPLYYLTGNSVNTVGTASLQVTLDNTSQSATDPASTEKALFSFTFSNSYVA